jgi:hypothetical protein
MLHAPDMQRNPVAGLAQRLHEDLLAIEPPR